MSAKPTRQQMAAYNFAADRIAPKIERAIAIHQAYPLGTVPVWMNGALGHLSELAGQSTEAGSIDALLKAERYADMIIEGAVDRGDPP